MILVKNLVRRFGSFTAVNDISFSLEKGEVVGFLGPNGAGKTTTMRMLTGFLPATKGSIEIAGHDVLNDSLEVRKRLGYLPEGVPLYKEHRVEEMLAFQGRLHGMSGSEIKRRSAEVLERVGMLDRSRYLVGKLSKGQRQRVGLAVALLPDPEVLILDEPTSGLDPIQRIEVRQLIRELAQDRTVLLSSHILPEVEAVCPRVIVLFRGEIAADGTHAELESSMAGEAYVNLEAMVGDAEQARRLIATLPGVESVEDRGRLGIHHHLRIFCQEDLREDVGALAAAKGWALRELSWQRPTLERLFTRLSMGIGPEETLTLEADAMQQPNPDGVAPALHLDATLGDSVKRGPSAPAMPMLNPFGSRAPASAPARPAQAPVTLNPFESNSTMPTPPPAQDPSQEGDKR